MRGRTQLWPALVPLCALTFSAAAATFEQFRVKSFVANENASTGVFNIVPHVRHDGAARSALIRHGRSRGHFTRNGRDRLRKEEGHPDAFAVTDERSMLDIDKPKKPMLESRSSTKGHSNYTLESYNDELSNYNPNETLEKYFGNFRHTLPSTGTSGEVEIISNSLDKIIITDNNVIIINKLRNETRTGYEPRFYDEEDMQNTIQEEDITESEEYIDATPMGKVSGHVDVVTRFLRIVESQHLLGENCTAGTDLNLGEGVVDRYAQERFRVEADVAVNRANMLTRLWKYAGPQVMDSEYLLHASVFSMVEFDDDIFAAGNCYDQYQYKDYQLFCPFAYRLPEGPILVKDLAIEYKYLSNTSEWFYIARKNAERVIKNHNQFSRGFNTYTHNTSAHTERVPDEILSVTYEDGKWSKPYYDCGGGNIWMLTYTVPFFGYTNRTYFFKGTSGIDIDLRRVDIDQCPLKPGSTQINIFAATDKCKKKTTECVSVSGLGFRRGSYRCVCRRGFYFPDTQATHRYYNGTLIEEQYEKLMMGEESTYSRSGTFECVPCAEGCDACADGSPCIAALNWLTRTAILVLACIAIGCLPLIVLFTIKYGHVKVVRAASPVLLRVIALGALLIYSTTLVMYGRPSVLTCTLRVWLREVGFCLTYGALMLKTWRISVIFRVRSAKAVKITDMNLLRRLGIIVGVVCVLLAIRTLVAPPTVIVGRTAEDLKAFLCKTDWWDHSFTSLEVSFLVWGIRLCIMVRKAPSEFNESRFISMAIYNEFLLSLFLNISMLFLQSPANPDLMYIIFFCHTQLTVTLLLCFIFGSKAYMVLKGHGKSDSDGTGLTNKVPVGKFVSKSRPVDSQYTMTANARYNMSDNISDKEIEDEFRRLMSQLDKLKDRNMRSGSRQTAIKIAAMQEALSRYELNPVQNRSEGLKLNTMLSAVADKLMCTTVTPAEESSSSGKDLNFDSIVLTHNAKIKSNVTFSPTKTKYSSVKKKELAPCVESESKSDNKSEYSTTLTDEVYMGPVKTTETNGVFKISGEANCSDIRAPGPESVGDNSACVDSEVGKEKKGVSKSNIVVISPTGSNQISTGKCASKAASHSRTHAIIINLDDKSKFTEEVTV